VPKIPTRHKREHEVEAMLAAWAEFEDSAAWQRSRKGNLWRHWEGMTLSIYARDDGYFGWCVAGEEGPRFSSGGYETEEDAMAALGETVGIGW